MKNRIVWQGLFLMGWLSCGGCADRPSPIRADGDVVEQPRAVVREAVDQPLSHAAENATPETSTGLERSLKILAWNVESDGSDPAVIATQLQAWSDVDIVALTEVLPSEFTRFAGGRQEIHSDSGNMDRLLIAFNQERFELVQQIDLDEVNNGRHRSPLIAHLRERSSGVEFMVMNNHLARGNAEFRQEQARKLVEWGRGRTIPVIAVGDYNFDFVFADETGNEAFKIFMRDGVWKWVRPEPLIDSNWFDGDGDGVDDYPGSILDFTFVAGPAFDWKVRSEVVVREGDFPDDDRTSDHRPILTIIE